MKKAINLLIGLIISIPMFAQTTYYYSKGQRIPVILDPTRVSVLTQKTSDVNIIQRAPLNTTIVETCVSDMFNFRVIENQSYGSGLLNYMQNSVGQNNLVLPCFKTIQGEQLILSERIDVKLQNPSQITALQNAVNTLKLRMVGQDQYMPLWYMVEITPQTGMSTIEVAKLLYENVHFTEAYPNFHSINSEISWDENVMDQWGLYNEANDTIDINASSAWNIATGKGVKVAILDQGNFDLNNIDISGNIYQTCDAEKSTFTSVVPITEINTEKDWHGMIVMSVVGCIRNNGIKLAGVAPDAKLVPIQFLTTRSCIFGINWAWKNGIDIINCSWGKAVSDTKLEEAMDSALYKGRNGKGCIIVNSSGNSNGSITYPGQYNPDLLVVGAIDSIGNRFLLESNGKIYGSCYGPKLDLVSPGVRVRAYDNNNVIISGGGTSLAAPHVAGVAALILERNPDLTGQQVRDIIEQNTTKVGHLPYQTVSNRPNGTWNEEYGYGLIDAYKALLATPRKQEEY